MSYRSDIIDIQAFVRIVRPASIGIADGSTEDEYDRHTGEIKEVERIIFLPLSQIEVDPPDYGVGDAVEIQVPEWLAKKKELV